MTPLYIRVNWFKLSNLKINISILMLLKDFQKIQKDVHHWWYTNNAYIRLKYHVGLKNKIITISHILKIINQKCQVLRIKYFSAKCAFNFVNFIVNWGNFAIYKNHLKYFPRNYIKSKLSVNQINFKKLNGYEKKIINCVREHLNI